MCVAECQDTLAEETMREVMTMYYREQQDKLGLASVRSVARTCELGWSVHTHICVL